MPILAKILAVLVVTGLAGAVASWSALTALDASASRAQQEYRTQMLPTVQLGELRAQVLTARLQLASIAMASTAADRATFKANMTKATTAASDILATYRPTAADRATTTELQQRFSAYVAFRDATLLPLAEKGDQKGFLAQRKLGADPLVNALMADLATLNSAAKARAADGVASSLSAVRSSRYRVIELTIGGLAVASALAIFLARQISHSLRQATVMARALATRDLTLRIRGTARDEIGRLAADLDASAESLQRTIHSVNSAADTVAAASEELSATVGQIADAAERSSVRAATVSATSSQVTTSVASVAGATEEMSASIREISDNASRAAQTASEAAVEARTVRETIADLGEASREIGNVISLITAIAEQTNLLALNATIEAARAGESGKGFAVVAGEVKELAQQTASATGDIASRVEAIQANTTRAVAAIEQINGTIDSINNLQVTIAGAVEQQTATTSEISRSVQEAASGSQAVLVEVEGVAGAADATSTGVADAQQATQELARMAAELRQLTGSFTV